MDHLMGNIAATASAMSAVQIQQSYSVSMAKKAMESQELAAQELLEMLPQTPAPASGSIIDVYA